VKGVAGKMYASPPSDLLPEQLVELGILADELHLDG
jgi:hypothetical protein